MKQENNKTAAICTDSKSLTEIIDAVRMTHEALYIETSHVAMESIKGTLNSMDKKIDEITGDLMPTIIFTDAVPAIKQLKVDF